MSFLSKVTGSTNQLAAESIARKGAFRVDAVLKLLETNDWDGVALATMVSSGKVEVEDILIALVGNDKSRNEAIQTISSILNAK